MNRRDLLALVATAGVSPAIAAVAEPFENYEEATGGQIGVYAANLATGDEIAWRAETRFVMCSTFKASLAALVLARVDAGRDDLADRVRFGEKDLLEYAPVARRHLAIGTMSVEAMCEAAVVLSDNTCANLLLARIGGPSALTEFWRSIGDNSSRLDHGEPLLNRTALGAPQDTTTPVAMARNLRKLVIGDVLSRPSKQRLTGWMVECRTGADRLRAGLPKDWRIGNKTGNNGRDAFGDIAVAWPKPDTPILICVYTQGGRPTVRQVATAFADIGQLVGRRLGSS